MKSSKRRRGKRPSWPRNCASKSLPPRCLTIATRGPMEPTFINTTDPGQEKKKKEEQIRHRELELKKLELELEACKPEVLAAAEQLEAEESKKVWQLRRCGWCDIRGVRCENTHTHTRARARARARTHARTRTRTHTRGASLGN